MKHFALVFYLIVVICNNLNAQNTKEAVVYLSTITENERQISKRFISFTSTLVHDNSAKKVEFRRKNLIKSVEESRNKIAAMPCFANDCALRDSLVSFLKLQYYVLNSDYDKILNMEEIAEESYDNMEAYMNARSKANELIQHGGEVIDEIYKVFARQHNILLSDREDKISMQIDKINKVFKHYDCVYLIFFKVNKQEAYMINSMNKKDFSGIEQNRKALISVANEGLAKLDTVKAFLNDKSLILACLRAIKFYKTEAIDKTPGLIDFLMKNENFEKVKKTFDDKEPSSRTQDEINQYNLAVKDINSASNKFNSVNNSLNESRKSINNDWVNTVNNYLERYVPDTNKKK